MFYKSISLACVLFAGILLTGVAEAKKSYENSVNETCNSSFDCGICHTDPSGAGPLTPEGQDYVDANYDPTIFCPGTSCTDFDGDGFAVEGGDCGTVDCDDSNAAINPGVAEVCDDIIDNDCDGKADCADGECANTPICDTGTEPEICWDLVDNDGDNKVDCADKKDCGKDPFCSGGGSDPEICDDGLDNDDDGKTDCADKKDCNKDAFCK
jgi:hypothetical protein